MDANTPSTSSASRRRAGDEPDVHNASVNEDAARAGACAQVHLATGAMCTLRHGHRESCEFAPPAQADALLAKRKTDERW